MNSTVIITHGNSYLIYLYQFVRLLSLKIKLQLQNYDQVFMDQAMSIRARIDFWSMSNAAAWC